MLLLPLPERVTLAHSRAGSGQPYFVGGAPHLSAHGCKHFDRAADQVARRRVF